MGWTEINFNEVNPTFDVLPQGDYTVEVLGARTKQQHNPNGGAPYEDITLDVGVVSPGEYAGRRLFVDLPDPTKTNADGDLICKWSVQAVKRLEQVLGLEITQGEHPTEVFSRNRGIQFAVPVIIQTYKNAAGEEVKKNKVQVFKARAI